MQLIEFCLSGIGGSLIFYACWLLMQRFGLIKRSRSFSWRTELLNVTVLISVITLVLISYYKFFRQQPTTKETVIMEQQMVTTPSGLQYIVLHDAPAGARHAQKGDMVQVHYTGWLYENGNLGAKFDSSHDRHEPFMFPLGAGMVIRGWDEGVALMSVGQKVRLIIPAQLGYGARGVPGVIPQNATLAFDVELLAID